MTEELQQLDPILLKHNTIELQPSPGCSLLMKNDQPLDGSNQISATTHVDSIVDSGLSPEGTNRTDIDKSHVDDESSSTSGVSSIQLEDSINGSGVLISDEKRVTDRVKVFEAVANHHQDVTIVKKDSLKNGHPKKSSQSINAILTDTKQQVSPSSSDSLDAQSISEAKSFNGKSKSKRTSLKKQLQNLLKIDKSPVQDELPSVEEHINGKKVNGAKQDSGTSNQSEMCAFCMNALDVSSPCLSFSSGTESSESQQHG
jgi:hypothetical protein